MGAGINVNMDYSGLFASLNKGSSLDGVNSLAGLLSDYSQIRSGTYRQTVKAYYAKVVNAEEEGSDKAEKSSLKKEYSDYTNMSESGKEMSRLADNAKKLSDAADTLTTASGKDSLYTNYDSGEALTAVKDFVSGYNKVYSGATAASDTNLQTRAKFMNSLTSNAEKDLAAIGISKGSDGKLSVDDEAFKKASLSDVKKVFSGRNSYAASVASSADLIDSSATRAASSNGNYTANATWQSNYSSILNSLV